MSTEELLEQIEDILEEGKTTLGGGKIKVDKEELLDVVHEIRLQMPEELIKARQIAADRAGIIDKARAKADEIVMAANEEAAKLVEETVITQKAKEGAADIIAQAKAQSDEIIANAKADAKMIADNAEKWARDMRASATDFVDNIMNETDEILSAGIDEMNKSLKDVRLAREQIKRATAKNK